MSRSGATPPLSEAVGRAHPDQVVSKQPVISGGSGLVSYRGVPTRQPFSSTSTRRSSSTWTPTATTASDGGTELGGIADGDVDSASAYVDRKSEYVGGTLAPHGRRAPGRRRRRRLRVVRSDTARRGPTTRLLCGRSRRPPVRPADAIAPRRKGSSAPTTSPLLHSARAEVSKAAAPSAQEQN